MTTFRNRTGHQIKNLEKAEEAFLEKAEEPKTVPDVVPQQTITAPPQKVRKYGFAAFNLRLDDNQLERLRRAALKDDRSMHAYAVRALMKIVDEDLK